MTAEIVKRLEESIEPTAFEMDFENGGMKPSVPEYWRRRKYFRAQTEADAVKTITDISSELNDAVEALNEIRAENELRGRHASKERD